MELLRRWWCGIQGHRKAEIMVDEGGFIVTDCPCRTVIFTALTDEVSTEGDLVSYFRKLLADYGYGDVT